MSRGAHCPGWNNYQLLNRNYRRRAWFEAAAGGIGPRETDRRRPGDPPAGCANTFTGKGRFFFTGAEGRSECKNAENSIRVLKPEETMPL